MHSTDLIYPSHLGTAVWPQGSPVLPSCMLLGKCLPVKCLLHHPSILKPVESISNEQPQRARKRLSNSQNHALSPLAVCAADASAPALLGAFVTAVHPTSNTSTCSAWSLVFSASKAHSAHRVPSSKVWQELVPALGSLPQGLQSHMA